MATDEQIRRSIRRAILLYDKDADGVDTSETPVKWTFPVRASPEHDEVLIAVQRVLRELHTLVGLLRKL